jgi:hypothetical protein
LRSFRVRAAVRESRDGGRGLCRDVALRLEDRHLPENGRKRRDRHVVELHREQAAVEIAPTLRDELELAQRIRARVDRLGARQRDEQIAGLDRAADTVVEGLTRPQVVAVEEHFVPGFLERQPHAFRNACILARVRQEHLHAPAAESRARPTPARRSQQPSPRKVLRSASR